jgi:hypothetical protein
MALPASAELAAVKALEQVTVANKAICGVPGANVYSTMSPAGSTLSRPPELTALYERLNTLVSSLHCPHFYVTVCMDKEGRVTVSLSRPLPSPSFDWFKTH